MVAKRPNFCSGFFLTESTKNLLCVFKKQKNNTKGAENNFKKVNESCTRTAAEGAFRGGRAVHLPKKKASRSLAKKAIGMKSLFDAGLSGV
jgi:hypothetical protein